jgi:hypothetical protein
MVSSQSKTLSLFQKVHWSVFHKGTRLNTQGVAQVKCMDLSEKGEMKGVLVMLMVGM